MVSRIETTFQMEILVCEGMFGSWLISSRMAVAFAALTAGLNDASWRFRMASLAAS